MTEPTIGSKVSYKKCWDGKKVYTLNGLVKEIDPFRGKALIEVFSTKRKAPEWVAIGRLQHIN